MTADTMPAAPARAARTDDRTGSLARALTRESDAVRELRECLVRQRAGVAADSTEAVQGSCDDIASILVRLDAARRHRTALLDALGDGRGTPTFEQLAAANGGQLPPALDAALRTLKHEAEATAREATVNRKVLERIVASGEAFLQALFTSAVGPDPVYRPGDRPDDGSGFLLDRKA